MGQNTYAVGGGACRKDTCACGGARGGQIFVTLVCTYKTNDPY